MAIYVHKDIKCSKCISKSLSVNATAAIRSTQLSRSLCRAMFFTVNLYVCITENVSEME